MLPLLRHFVVFYPIQATNLREWAGAGAPPGQEDREADGLEDAGNSANGDGVERALLSSDLGDERWSRGSEEDQATKIGSTLVAKRASCVDQGTDTVGLDGRANERGTPCGCGGGGLLGLEELLLGVGGLSLAVGLAENWAEDREGDGVGVEGAERDGRWLDWGKVVKSGHCIGGWGECVWVLVMKADGKDAYVDDDLINISTFTKLDNTWL